MKPNSIKVEKTELHKDPHGNNILSCKGKLVIMHTDRDPCVVGELIYCVGTNPVVYSILTEIIVIDKFDTLKYWKSARPVIISETETIENTKTVDAGLNGNWYYSSMYKYISRIGESLYDLKVLALPEHFSPAHLKEIINKSLKDGDIINIECAYDYHNESVTVMQDGKTPQSFIKLNKDYHIILHDIKQKESWDEIFSEYESSEWRSAPIINYLRAFYNVPTRK